ncbi:MAG: hypothetical protein L6R38_005582 [Xanthoria sp. 2 TBL-2021]|nr:MAG: hypothetical protein L6R38_005582 [Xanthoria sp. 2 TBL-2021]
MERCFKYFNEPANFNDCEYAFNMLPEGPEPIIWKNRLADRGDPYALPFQVVHGSCEIIFQTSGPAADQVNTLKFPGNELRRLAGRVMDQCIEKPGEGQGGGFITRDFKHLLQSITFPGTPFFEHFPISSTFLTVLIWNRYAHAQKGHFAYNPGNQDQMVAEEIEEQLYRAEKRWRRGSSSRLDLIKRQDAVAYALPALEYVARGTPNWFDFYPAPTLCGEGEDREVGVESSIPGRNCTGVARATSRQRRRGGDATDE